eukprot:4224679-Prorocentrum_lima.AAC.1
MWLSNCRRAERPCVKSFISAEASSSIGGRELLTLRFCVAAIWSDVFLSKARPLALQVTGESWVRLVWAWRGYP